MVASVTNPHVTRIKSPVKLPCFAYPGWKEASCEVTMKTSTMIVAGVLVFAVFVVAIPQSSAETMYVCVNNKNGSMRYVTGPNQCAKTETQISWTSAEPAAPALQVIDSNEKQVGIFAGFLWPLDAPMSDQFREAVVFLTVNSQSFALRLNDKFYYPGNKIYYTSLDCTGTPYLSMNAININYKGITQTPVGITSPGQTVHLPQSGSTPVTIQVQSYWLDDTHCGNFSPPNSVFEYVIEAYPLVNLNTMFTPPFKVVVKP